MAIKYVYADDVKKRGEDIIKVLNLEHIDLENIAFIRSFGSRSKYTIARCHALGKAMQIGMRRQTSFYLIEVISEKFDKLTEEDKIKVIIHEIMHIPKTFGGGFIQHDKVNEKNVSILYKKYFELKYDKIFIEGRKNISEEWF